MSDLVEQKALTKRRHSTKGILVSGTACTGNSISEPLKYTTSSNIKLEVLGDPCRKVFLIGPRLGSALALVYTRHLTL